MPVGRLLPFSWFQKALWSQKEIHPAPLRFTVWALEEFSSRSWKSCFGFLLGFFYWKHFSMRFASFFWKIAMTTLFWCVSHALTRAPWVMDFSFAPPRGNNSAVRSGLRPTVIPAAEVGGWWLVVSGWWLAISRVIFTNSISRELGCLLHGFTWKWKWIRWIQRGLFSKCFTRR